MTMDAADMAWWEMELPSGVVFFSDRKAALFGGKPKDFVHYTDYTKRLNKKEYETSMKLMRDHVEGNIPHYATTYTVKGLDGITRTLFDKGRVVRRDEDGTIKIMGVIVDITEAPLKPNS